MWSPAADNRGRGSPCVCVVFVKFCINEELAGSLCLCMCPNGGFP